MLECFLPFIISSINDDMKKMHLPIKHTSVVSNVKLKIKRLFESYLTFPSVNLISEQKKRHSFLWKTETLMAEKCPVYESLSGRLCYTLKPTFSSAPEPSLIFKSFILVWENGEWRTAERAPVMENLEAWLALGLLIRTHRSQKRLLQSRAEGSKKVFRCRKI